MTKGEKGARISSLKVENSIFLLQDAERTNTLYKKKKKLHKNPKKYRQIAQIVL